MCIYHAIPDNGQVTYAIGRHLNLVCGGRIECDGKRKGHIE